MYRVELARRTALSALARLKYHVVAGGGFPAKRQKNGAFFPRTTSVSLGMMVPLGGTG